MKIIQSFLLDREDYQKIRGELYKNELFKIPLLNLADFNAAIENKCTIYAEEIGGNLRPFIQVPKGAIFKYAR